MAENKTTTTKANVMGFLNSIEPEQKRKDAKAIAKIMRNATGDRARMWGPSIVGYGQYHYRYNSGRAGDFMRVGFSPRKQNISVYVVPGFTGFSGLLKKLGKHKVGSSCLYINKLADVNVDVLAEIVEKSVKIMNKKYPL